MNSASSLRDPQPVERRAVGRARTDCAILLRTPGSDWHGRLWDLSQTGARVQVDKPPPQGVSCLVRWLDNEVFCRIVWSASDMCGVQFERPISRALVGATIGQTECDASSGSAASVTNIPIGRRRGRLWSASEA